MMFGAILNMFIFFDCPKKTNQKKGQPTTGSASGGLPCAARKERTLRKVASLRRIVLPLFTVLLGSVKWQKQKR